MKRFSKLLAVVLAIAVVICPMTIFAETSTSSGTYKIELVDANTVQLTINSTDGFVAYHAIVGFNSNTAFQSSYNADGYVDGLKVNSYTLKTAQANDHNAPTIRAHASGTSLNVIVMPSDTNNLDLCTKIVIRIRVASGATASLTKIQAADNGTVDSDNANLLTFPAAGSDGVIDTESEDYNPENATTAHTHNLTLVPAVPATCTAAGNSAYYTCSGCDKIFSDENGETETTIQEVTIDALGHSFTNYVSNNDATCTQDGTKTAYCDRKCGAADTITDIGSAHHTPATAVVENNVPATCTTAGSYDSVVKCSVCNTELSRETVNVPATGVHTADEAVEENRVEATCGVDGHYDSVVYCSVCHAEISRTQHTIPATGAHTYTYTANGDGTHTVGCANCAYSETEDCDTAGEDGACSKCEYKAHVCTHEHAEYKLVNVTASVFTFEATCPECSENLEKTEPVGSPVDNITPLCTIAPKNDISMLYEIAKSSVDGIYTNLAIVLVKDTYLKDSVNPEDPQPVYMVGMEVSAVYKTYYEFKFSNISAYEMNNNISATVYGYNSSNEWVRLGSRDFSVVQYAKSNFNNTSLRPVLADMIVYGSYMQTYCGQNVANLAINELDDTQRSYATYNFPESATDCNRLPDSVTTTVPGSTETPVGTLKVARSLKAGSKIDLQFVMTSLKPTTMTDDIRANLYCVVQYYQDKNTQTSVTYNYALNGSVYNSTYASFIFDKAPVSMLDYPVTASFYYGDPAESGVLLATNTYSVETYIAANLGGNVNLANVLKSMYAFGKSLATYAKVDPYVVG